MESEYQRHGAVSGNPRARIAYSSSAPQPRVGSRYDSNAARSTPQPTLDSDSHESFQYQQLRGEESDSGDRDSQLDKRRHYDLPSRHTQRSSAPSRSRPNDVNEDDSDPNECHDQESKGRQSESPRRRDQRPELPPDRQGKAARRGSDSQNDRHLPSRRGPMQGIPQPPSSAYLGRANINPTGGFLTDAIDTADICDVAANIDSLSSTPTDSEMMFGNLRTTPATRRDSINSLVALAQNNFEFSALIITERTNSPNKRVPLHTQVLALADSGCALDLVHEDALKRACIKPQDIEGVGKILRFVGIGGKKSCVRQRVKLSWGKARDEGRLSDRRYFYIVEDLPDNLEMVFGREFMRAAIEKHAN